MRADASCTAACLEIRECRGWLSLYWLCAAEKFFPGTRLRFSYATGYMEPAIYQAFASLPYYVPNPGLLPERTRAFEAGIQQNLFEGRWTLGATYFNNLFHDQIEAAPNQQAYQGNPPGTLFQFFNVQQSLAEGAELQLQGKIRTRLLFNAAYTSLSTDICRLRFVLRRISAIRCLTPGIRCSGGPNSQRRRCSAIWGRDGGRAWGEVLWGGVQIQTLRVSGSPTQRGMR